MAMETIILLIALLIETAFAIYCIRTKSNQVRVQSFIRIGAFGAFVLFTLVTVIQWSFRWYALAALLFLWAALGAWTLLRRTNNIAFMTGRSIVQALTAFLLVLVALIPALIFPQSALPAPTGKYAVATLNYTYTDSSRTETFTNTGEPRKVNVEFWYPKETGTKYPLVVFSHGAFGMKTSNTSTFMNLASNGYVVISIDHPYHSLVTVGADGHPVTVDPSFFREVMDVNSGKYDPATVFKLESKWMQLRTRDINFVLDTVLAQAQTPGSDPVYQLIDVEKIGLMGHSLGGESAAQVARERNDIDAVVNLDADLHGEYLGSADGKVALNDSVYPVPLLTIFSDTLAQLIDAVPDANTLVAVMHVTATAPHAYAVFLAGTDHMSLTDLPLVSPLLVSIINSSVPKGGGVELDKFATLEKMNHTILEFFNAFLKGGPAFSP